MNRADPDLLDVPKSNSDVSHIAALCLMWAPIAMMNSDLPYSLFEAAEYSVNVALI